MNTNTIWKSSRWLVVAGALVTFGLSSCNEDDTPPITSQSLLEIASSTPAFSTLISSVDQAGLTEALASGGPLTVFAPNNEAFNAFLTEQGITAEELLSNPQLPSILNYHLVEGRALSADIEAGALTTNAGQPFYVSVDPNGSIWINGKSRVTQADVQANNGILHVVDNVIIAPSATIAQIAVEASQSSTPEFTQLVAALTRADLVEAVSGAATDNLTVFAPTDAAFQELFTTLGVSSVDEIPLETLTSVLLYHVVPARIFSQDLRQDATLPTLLEGQSLRVDLANLRINESGLLSDNLNIHAINGVIHPIDQLLLPPVE